MKVEKVTEAIKQGIIEWSEKNPGQVHPLQIAKVDFSKGKGINEMVEHFLTEHDGNIDGLKEKLANAQITITDD